MRSLERNKRGFRYATVVGTESILDEYGNDTLEVRTKYGSPTLLRANISANIGQEAFDAFGSQTEYSRTVSLTGESCPLSEGDKVWFGVEPNVDGDNNNYTVARVADSKNGFLLALREVSKRD